MRMVLWDWHRNPSHQASRPCFAALVTKCVGATEWGSYRPFVKFERKYFVGLPFLRLIQFFFSLFGSKGNLQSFSSSAILIARLTRLNFKVRSSEPFYQLKELTSTSILYKQQWCEGFFSQLLDVLTVLMLFILSNTPSLLCCLKKDSTGKRRLLCTSRLRTGEFQLKFSTKLLITKPTVLNGYSAFSECLR